jgi:chromosome segregation ATPase
MNTKRLRFLAALPAVALLATLPLSASANEATARAEAATAEIKGDAAKMALEGLDVEIDHVEALIEHAPTAEDKASAQARLKVLKERRSELRKNYAQARFDELKADVRTEANRVGAWTKRTFTKSEGEKAMDKAEDSVDDAKDAAKRAGNSAYAYANTAGATTDLAAYKLRPTDTNKEEAKLALKALEAKIDELETRVGNMPRGADRDAAKRRVKALEERKDKLEREFNKARFDALIDDVKSEWNN